MYENVKLKRHKGLRECTLLSLGKINILCGKNNSGKSTILETINNKDLSIVGKVVTAEDIEKFFIEACNHVQWLKIYHDSNIGITFKKALSDTFSANNGLWFKNESSLFADTYQKKSSKDRILSGYSINDSFLLNYFEKMFPIISSTDSVLLPPKRNLNLIIKVDSNESITPLGGGIINYLFKAKNQSKDSTSYKDYLNLAEAFYSISAGYGFEIHLQDNNELHLRFSRDKQEWIEASDCGLGLQDLLVILFMSINQKHSIILIEEPESHIHPDMQRRLLYYLKNNSDKQFFFSTHSNIFLDNSLIDKAYLVFFDDQVRVTDVTNKASVLNELGYSIADNLVSDLIILTEGPKDAPIIEEFLIKIGLLAEFNIKTWPLGGDIMDQIDLSVLTQSQKVLALIDSDPKSNKVRDRFIKNCKKYNVKVTKLKKYAIENYFTVDALKKVYTSDIPDSFESIAPYKKLEDQIGFNPKKKNREIAQSMSLEDIKGTDLYKFFMDVQKECRA